MVDISNLQRDGAIVETGRWVNEIPGFGDAELRVRGLSSPYVVNYRARLERACPREDRLSDGTLKPEVAMRIFGITLHEVVLLEWRGFTNKGEEVPYDKELAKKWCTDKNFLPFQDGVTFAAQVVDRGLVEAREGDAGN